MAATAVLGRQVGDFRLLDELGQGGMGTAYRAEQITLRREAVVKVISEGGISDRARTRFLREARLASRFDHPFAAHVYAFGAEADGLLWIAMELVRGIPLDRMIDEQGAMPLVRFVPFFDRLCEVVHSAHEQGIVHRDIKPANVMVLRRAGRLLPKLLDFGVARTALDVEDSVLDVDDAPLVPGARSITIRGACVGSPEFMAPEQWMDATRATSRSDLYALAITAYETLTARKPFTGATLIALARAHARGEVPTVGPGLPAGLDRAFRRALAKLETDRYENVLDFAAAIRDTARDTTAVQVTDLDEAVRDTFVQGGPQPLAEALLGLAATRDPTAALEQAWRVVDVLVRVLGVISLAARARVGAQDVGAEVTRRVRALVERGLDVEEWVELAAIACEPFARRQQAHPVPELVALFWTGNQRSGTFDDLDASQRGGQNIDAEHVRHVLATLAELLRACTFLIEYAWVVANNEGESWMGPRRQPRDRRALSQPAAAGSVWLLDRDGASVLELSPLVSIAPPAPGADAEMFMIDGPARRGARLVAWPREFERFDESVRAYVDDQLAPLASRKVVGDAVDATPYRGLASFGRADAAMFFGRESQVEAVVNRLRVQPLIAVVGPSGVGKSSFVHAGVLPALPESWQPLSFRPGAMPLRALQHRLSSAGIHASGLADALHRDPRALGVVLEEAAQREGSRTLLVVDQLEEVFTQCRDVPTRDAFARALAAIGGPESRVHVIFTLRDDFLVRTAELPELGPKLASSLDLVTLPDPSTLRRILVEPLRYVGYRFELEALPDEMVASVREHPGALALLSFAAAKLWELRDRKFRHISRRAYEAIGGVAGALARHAEETLAALPAEDHRRVRELFRHLVTSEGTRALLLRHEALELLGKTAAAERVIETLIQHRLIVGYEGDAKTERIEVIHEALLSAWPRLVTWQREDAEGARLRDQLRSAARQWGDRDRPKGLLWRGEALVELKIWRTRYNAALTDLETDFIGASVADETRARRLRRGAFALVITGLIVGLVILQRSNRIAERNAAEAERKTRAMLVEQGRTEMVTNHPQEAMAYLSDAYSRGAEDRNLPFLLGVGSRTLGGAVLVLRGHKGSLTWLGITPDGDRIVSSGADATVRIWNASSGALEHTIEGTGGGVIGYGENATPQLLSNDAVLTSGPAERPTIWDVRSGTRVQVFPAPGAAARATSDGATVVTLERDKLRTWNAVDGSPRRELPVSTADQLRLAVNGNHYIFASRDGAAVGSVDLDAPPRVASTSGEARLFIGGGGTRVVTIEESSNNLVARELERLDAPVVLRGHASEGMLAEFSPDGFKVLSTSFMDRSVRIWDIRTGWLLATLEGHQAVPGPATWSADGSLVATGGLDRTARTWIAETGAPSEVFYDQSDMVSALVFDDRRGRLVVGSHDGTISVYELHGSVHGRSFDRAGPLILRFSKSSSRMLLVGHDSAAWVYDISTNEVVASIEAPPTHEPAVSRFETLNLRHWGDIDDQGTTIVIPAGRVARRIDLTHPTASVTVGPHPADVTGARFLRAGRLVTTTADGKVFLWSAAGTLDQEIDLNRGRIDDLDVDPTSSHVVVASDDGSVVLLDLVTTRPPLVIAPARFQVNGVAFSHDGTRIATAAVDSTARIFDLSGKQLATANGSAMQMTAAFSPDDLRIAVTNFDGTVAVHDSSDGRLLARFAARGGWPSSAAFSPDGKQLVEVDDRGQLHTWSVELEHRPPSAVARDVLCHVPFQLVGTQLFARQLPRCQPDAHP